MLSGRFADGKMAKMVVQEKRGERTVYVKIESVK